jgi:hypothetical protein
VDSGKEEIISLTNAQVCKYRAKSHFLDKRLPPGSLLRVTRELGGIQAQVLGAAQLQLWARVEDLTLAELEQVLWQERKLVKIWSMRSTLHLIPSDEYYLYINALKKWALQREQKLLVKYGLNYEESLKLVATWVEMLADGPLTRRELAEGIGATYGPEWQSWVKHNWGGIIKQAMIMGFTCFGPNRGAETTFARGDNWLSNSTILTEKEAQDALLRRYLRRYSPATPTDFAFWTGSSVKEISAIWNRLLESQPEALVQVKIEGKPAWLFRENLPELLAASEEYLPTRLLPTYDVYVLAHKDKSQYLDMTYYKRVYREAAIVSAVVLIDGQVAGVWSYTRKSKKVEVRVELFNEVPQFRKDEIEVEAVKLGQFLGLPSELSFGN